MAVYIAIAVLIIVIHLVAVKMQYRYVKSVSKVCLIPYIFLAFLVFTESFGASVPRMPLLMTALAFYTLGDLLLEFNKESLFRLGGISFSVGHILYAAYFLSMGFSLGMGILFIGIWVLVYIFLFEPQMKALKPNSTEYFVYACIVMLLGIAVGAADFGGNWMAKMIAVAGTLSYGFSDALVIIRQSRNESEKEKVDDDLLIMVTYIGANILLLASITLSVVMA